MEKTICPDCRKEITGGFVWNEARNVKYHYRCWYKEQVDDDYGASWEREGGYLSKDG